jgi:TP901 family phage tail tape measure protein
MNLKELKYIIYGEDRLSNKLQRINSSSSRTNNILTGTNTRLSNLKTNLSQAASQVPFLQQGLAMLINPITILGGVSLGLASGLNKMSNEAIRFNSSFRQVKNLNLDKTVEDLSALKQEVLDLSFYKGFDPNQAATAFFDIQSVTGKYGEEVSRIVSKQGEFAKLMQADFTNYIAGTGVAMANYGFDADELDEYNRSAYAAYKVGKITYDELAKITPVYAGSASAAKQSFESANKVLALFTVKTKSAEEAATLTNSAFRDLFKEETIKAFERVGIDMFDQITGKARQVDQIMLDLNAKFMTLESDKAITGLRNQFKGSEGLIALINAASDKSGQLVRTFQSFDDAEIGLDKVMANAREDLDYINEQLENRTRVLSIQIGQNLLPARAKFMELGNKMAIDINAFVTGKATILDMWSMMWGFGLGDDRHLSQGLKDFRGEFSRKDSYQTVKDEFGDQAFGAKKLSDEEFKQKYGELLTKSRDAYNRAQEATGNDYYKLLGESQAYSDIAKSLFKERHSGDEQQENDYAGGTTGTDVDNISKGLSGIAGGGSQQRNITVNISKFFDNQNINCTNLHEAGPEIEEKIKELMIRAISGAEQIMN